MNNIETKTTLEHFTRGQARIVVTVNVGKGAQIHEFIHASGPASSVEAYYKGEITFDQMAEEFRRQ